MIPLRVDTTSERFPFVTVLLIGMNLAAFAYEVTLPSPDLQRLIFHLGAVPSRFNLFHGPPGLSSGAGVWITLVTSMFLHGGFLHVGGNMLYLWIFGDNVEDVLGHFRFLGFYFLCGLAAGLFQIAASPASPAPLVGA